jgi:hypothetical protein
VGCCGSNQIRREKSIQIPWNSRAKEKLPEAEYDEIAAKLRAAWPK